MPIHEVETPDGSIMRVEAPEGASQDAILAFASQNYQPKELKESPESGGIAAAKASVRDIIGQGALTLGRVGLMNPEEAQLRYEKEKQRSAEIFKPTEGTFFQSPLAKTSELLGGSLPYMAAPLVGAAVANPLGAGLIGAGAVSAGQFVGSNLARQLDEGKKEGKTLADTSLTSAVAASIPQALLDTYALKMTPLIRGVFGKAGQEITEKTAQEIAKKGILGTITDVGLTANREGITEAGQQVLERLQAGLNIADEEARKEYFDSYVGGAVLGGVLGAGGHFIEKTMQNKPENEYDSLMTSLRTHFDTASDVPMTDVVGKISELTGEKDLNKIQNFLGGAEQLGHLETVPNEDNTLSIKFKQPTPIEQADDLQKNANPDIYRPEVFESHAELYKAIVPKLKKFGLENVGVKIMDSIENGRADGLWANKVIHLAMDSPNPIGTMRHESVHALRQLGGFKPNEWTVLTNKAKDEWVDKFIKKADLYDQYKDQYVKDNGNLTGFDDYIHEEAIAEAFKHFDQTKPPAGLVGNIYQRLKQFFETIRNGFEGNGFNTADSIFRSLDEGKRAPVQLKKGEINEQSKYNLAQYDEEGRPVQATPINGAEAGEFPRRGELLGGEGRIPQPSRVLAPTQSLDNNPPPVTIPSLGQVSFGAHPQARQVAQEYMANKPYFPATSYVKVDPEQAKRVADAYENMKDDPTNPQVKASYDAMIKETLDQWQAIKKTGLKVEFMQEGMDDPYAESPRLAILDAVNNNHLWVFPTDFGYGEGNVMDEKNNPLLAYTDEIISGKRARANDIFRIVHDYFGHIKDGVGFRADGEENAWRSHVQMYSPLARNAMTIETRGQNSWVNFGPYAEFNKTASAVDTKYAPQKIGLLPEEFVYSGSPFETDHNIGEEDAKKYSFKNKELRPTENAVRPSGGGGEGISLNPRQANAQTYVGHHYSKGERQYLDGSKYGSLDGIAGQEQRRLQYSNDPRIKKRVYFYIPHSELDGKYLPPEQGLGSFKHVQTFNNILGPGPEMSRIYEQSGATSNDMNPFESAVVDAGYDGYAAPRMGMMVILNHDNIPVSFGKYAIRAPLQNAFDYARGKDFKTNRDLKVDLQKIALQKNQQAKINIENFDNKTIEYLSNLGVADALHAIKTNENAVGWYDVTVAKALNIISLLHPEIKTDPDAKFAFTWALAVTSNGIKVDKNFELAEQAYNYYKNNGVMPTDIQAGESQKGINNGLKTFNEMVAKYGIDNTRKFMATEFTPKEIENLTGLKILGENVGTKLLGASIIGPKIGNGFYSNLNGIFDKLTMDRWLMRTWGRWTGTLIENNVAQTKASKTLVDTLLRQMVNDKETKKNFEQVLKKSITKTEVKTEEGRALLAKNIAKSTVKSANRDVFNRTTLGENLRKASNNLAKYLDGQKEAPKTGTERNQIRAVFNSMLKKLQARGYNDLTMADLQALLWYPERRLYDVAKESDTNEGYDDSEAPDYANAAAKLVKENGVSETQINQVIKQTENQYVNRARGVQPNAGNNTPQTSTQGKTRGFTEEERAKFSEQYAPPKPEKAPRVKKEKYSLRAPNTPAFRAWFKGSKVVDEDGKPLIVYHGTAGDAFDVFDKNKIRLMDYDAPFNGFWFSSDKATSPAMRDAKNVISVYLSIKNPAPSNVWKKVSREVYSDQNIRKESRSDNDEVRHRLQDMGYDGIKFSGKPDINANELNEKGYTSFKDVSGKSYTLAKNKEDGGLDLYDGKTDGFPNPQTEEYITGYSNLQEYLNTEKHETWVTFEPNQIKSVFNQAPTESNDIRYSLKAPNTPAFKRWFGNSKIVNTDGTPKVMYHGTAQDIFEFRPKQANAIFVTDNPRFAEGFSDLSSNYMVNEIEKNLPKDKKEKLYRQAKQIAKKEETDFIDEYNNLIKNELPSAQNIIPVFVRSEKPFDYENKQDKEKLWNSLNDDEASAIYRLYLDKDEYSKDLVSDLNSGSWKLIESHPMQHAIKKAGFDGFYIREGGNKNLAVYEPSQLKSATGNQGTFDITSPDIRYALRASKTPAFQKWFGDSVVINEQGEPQIVYTGTSKDKDFTSFNVPKNGTWFTTNPEMASSYASQNDSQGYKRDESEGAKPWDIVATNTASRVIPAFLKIENPFKMTDELFKEHLGGSGSYKRKQANYFETLKYQGYDGIDMGDGIWVVLKNPNQIKTAFNMNPTEKKDMRYSIYPGPRLTKIEAPKSTVNVVKDTASEVWDNIHDNNYLTQNRIAWVDRVSGLTQALQKLPQFDMNGKLRADLLIRAKFQTINFIKNAIQSGIPILNADGTLGVERSENNLARSLILADELDSKFKQFGFTGRSGVAEVARILRGEEIMKEDAVERAKGDALVKQANAHLKMASDLKNLHKFELEYAKKLTKEAKVLYNAGKLREGNLKASEARRIYETNFYREILKETKEARKLMNEGKPLQKVFREFQVTDAKIKWANNILKQIPETENVLSIWRNVNRGLIDLWVETGILDEQTASKYKARDRYVPLFKSREDLDAEGLYNSTGTGTKSTAKIKTLKGAMIDRNIWENMDKHFAKMVAQAYENQTRRVGVDQLKYFGLATITKDRTKANLFFKENGKEVMAIVENPNDLAAFQAMTYEISPIMKMFVPMTKVLRTGALLNPMYWIKQLIRDPIHASLVANSGIVTPFHSMVEFARVIAKNSEEAKILADRGVIGAVDNTLTINEFLKQVGKEKTNPHALAGALHKIMEIHEASDAATRVAIYKKAFAEGMKKFGDKQKATDYAVFKARESINFSVHGNSPILQQLRATIPFFSAAITSLDTVYRAATGYGLNADEKAQARRIFASRAAMMVMLSTVYAMMYQDDDQYKKLPDYVKDDNWLIPTPDGKTFIKIPTPFEVGFLFKTIPEGAVRYMAGTSTGKELMASYYGGLLKNLPANGIPIPQAVKPILETITNHSFFTGNPIEGMSDQGLPVSMRGQRASEFSKMLSRLGLDGIGLSPAKIDNLFQGYFAELGTLSTGMASSLVNLAEGREPPASNIQNLPFMKSFLTDPNVSKAVSDFYSLQANAKQMADAVNRFKGEGNIEGIKDILNDEEKKKAYASAAPLRKIGEEMTKIRKAINFYKQTQDIDPEERRRKINELTQIYNKIAESGYTVADAIGVVR